MRKSFKIIIALSTIVISLDSFSACIVTNNDISISHDKDATTFATLTTAGFFIALFNSSAGFGVMGVATTANVGTNLLDKKEEEKLTVLLKEMQAGHGIHLAKFLSDVDPSVSKEEILDAYKHANENELFCTRNQPMSYEKIVEQTREQL